MKIKGDTGNVKSPELSSERLAGCFKANAAKKNVSTRKAIEKATEIVAHETAKGH